MKKLKQRMRTGTCVFVIFGARKQPATLEALHRREKLAPKPGVEFMVRVSGSCVRGLMHVDDDDDDDVNTSTATERVVRVKVAGVGSTLSTRSRCRELFTRTLTGRHVTHVTQ